MEFIHKNKIRSFADYYFKHENDIRKIHVKTSSGIILYEETEENLFEFEKREQYTDRLWKILTRNLKYKEVFINIHQHYFDCLEIKVRCWDGSGVRFSLNKTQNYIKNTLEKKHAYIKALMLSYGIPWGCENYIADQYIEDYVYNTSLNISRDLEGKLFKSRNYKRKRTTVLVGFIQNQIH